MSNSDQWIPCDKPKLGDSLRWNEPLWAAPTKARGKRDQVGEQQITATLMTRSDLLEFKVIEVQKISGEDAVLSVQPDDIIKRKKTSIALGQCHKLVAEEGL
jgi:hypothetical protein